jgi:tripartite-type tricarboxylate transporter receptor subunit TctC
LVTRIAISIATLICASVAVFALAQVDVDYPAQPLRLIIPNAPGGSSTFIARMVQPKRTELLGAQIIVGNRGGAAGCGCSV